MKKVIKISQSLIKDIANYEKGNECGLIMDHKWIKGKLIESDSPAINQGSYFEYIATGQLPKNGRKPKPEMLKSEKRLWTKDELNAFLESGDMPGQLKTPPLGVESGMKIREAMREHKRAVAKGSMTAPYRTAYSQAMNFQDMCEDMGIEILATGEVGERDGLVGVRDIKARYKGEIITIDTKYSGLIHDEWSSMGWASLVNGPSLNPKGYERQVEYHKVQAVQYTHIFENPFYFWVFSSATNAEESKENLFLKMEINDPLEFAMHLDRAKYTSDRLKFYIGFGFEPRPTYNKCQTCPLLDGCKSATKVQEPIIIKL